MGMLLATTPGEAEDVRQWSEELARDPSSGAFMPLAETLRRQGKLEPARQVATRAVARHPHNPGARDLLARILVDGGELHAALDEWAIVLQLAPGHLGAIKGMAFVRFQQGMHEEAERLLKLAESQGGDANVTAAIDTVRRVSGGMTFRSFVNDIASAVAQHVDPRRVKIAEAVSFWSGQGYRTTSLQRLLEANVSEADSERTLREFAATVERLRELEGRVIASDPDLGSTELFRDPERLAEAEALATRAFVRKAPAPLRAANNFFLDDEKVVWRWPDLAARLTEDVR